MRVSLIVNPAASGVTDRVVDLVAGAFAHVAGVDLHTTERPGHATDLAAAADSDAVIAVGGDGVVNEVANGIAAGMVMGVVPAGASSVFARQLGFPPDPARAAAMVASALAAGARRTIGLGELNGRRFTFAASIGFDAAATGRVGAERRSSETLRRAGDLHVLMLALDTLRADRFRLAERMAVAADGGAAERCAWLAIANQHPYTYFGRVPVKAAPAARFDAGLDAVVCHALRPVDLWRLAVYGLLWPRHARGGDSRIGYLHDVSELVVECDLPIAHQLDGEYLGELRHARIRRLPAALTVLVPVAGASV